MKQIFIDALSDDEIQDCFGSIDDNQSNDGAKLTNLNVVLEESQDVNEQQNKKEK